MADPNNVKLIFLAAIDLLPAERAAFLQKAASGDDALCSRVAALLKAHEEPNSFLDAAAAAFDATVDARSDAPLAESPGSLIGPYKLLEQIGEGGMGVVFMAEQTKPVQRTVALKIIKPGMDTRQVIARFEAERQALAMMDHPNIARVLDAGTTETGRPYFVMELVKGVPITKYCDEKRLPLSARLELFAEVCQAVQHAHQKGVIHRDIKPTNVLVAEYDGKPVPKVIDFGVAKATAQKLTERTMFTEYGQLIGTFEYMSPEQARFNQLDVDTRSDIYSLGVLLYEVLAGSTPLEKERLRSAAFDEVLRIICEEEPPRPSTRLSSSQSLPSIAANRSLEPKKLSGLVRGELDWIVMKCLEKDRNRRYATANELERDVARYLQDEPVMACPPSAVYRFRKFARRNKLAFIVGSAAMAALVLLVLGLAVSNRLIAAERDQKSAALKEKEQALAAAKVSEENAQRNAQTAVAETKRAEKNLLRASIAIREVLMKAAMGFGEWSDLPQPLRKQLSEEAVKYYESLIEDNSPDPNRRYESAIGFRAIGTLHNRAGNNAEGENSLRSSIGILDQLATEYPAVPQYRHQLAWSLYILGGTLHRTQRLDEAKGATQKAVELYERLVSEGLGTTDYRAELSKCYVDLAQWLRDKGEFQQAESLLNQAIAHLEKWSHLPDETAAYDKRLATIYNSLGRIRTADHRAQEANAAYLTAAEFYKTAAALCEAAFSDTPSAARLFSWADCYQGLLELPSDVLPLAEAENLYRRFVQIKSLTPGNLTTAQDGHVQRLWAFKLQGAGRLVEAEEVFGNALAVFEKLMTDEPGIPDNWHFAADTQRLIAQMMVLRERHEQAEPLLRRSIEIHEQGAARFATYAVNEGERAAVYNSTAWLLATSPVLRQRNPAQAVEFAKKAVEIQPTSGRCWNTLGVAQYRAGQWQPAAEALAKSTELRDGGDAFDWFFLAMAHSRLDQKDEARAWYDKADEWTDKNQPNNEELRRFRDEAKELLISTGSG